MGADADTPPSGGYSLAQKCAAEALGVGLIVGEGCGIVCASKFVPQYPMGPFGISSVFGMSVAAAIYATRDISGAHLNPAVTGALAVFRPEACPPQQVAPYWAAQLFGGAVAAGVNYMVYNSAIRKLESAENITRGARGSWAVYSGAFGMVPNPAVVGPMGACLVEAGLTATLMFVILAVTDEKKSVPSAAAPALIGMTVTALAAQYGPVTGAGMNPARDLGPRFITSVAGWGKASASPAWWAYTAGPMAGALFGAALYTSVFEKANSV
eukprot:TRINITY_DN430_c0_g2_i1.p2 TRINITY_DN430_c0_g2~~TRINITY_DN430_c0_g2_i1.p2  ORF type:complete len:269 (+),score=88.87 TRINITY_DN430_c0_g2_i1:53-859(+)